VLQPNSAYFPLSVKPVHKDVHIKGNCMGVTVFES
jgi:hypothetical protein